MTLSGSASQRGLLSEWGGLGFRAGRFSTFLHHHISPTLHIFPLRVQWRRSCVPLFPAKAAEFTPMECDVLVALTKWSSLSPSSTHLPANKSLGIGVCAPVTGDRLGLGTQIFGRTLDVSVAVFFWLGLAIKSVGCK